ncbi:MAG: HAMP domain-containing sensor histidine kinase [Pseudomonadota bacterium]
MVRAATLSTLFETIETEAMFDRVAGAEFEAGRAARAFADGIAAGRDTAFRAVVAEILSDERDEAVAAFAGLDRLRRQLALAWGGLAIALVAAAAVFTLVFYRRLMRPIAALARAAEALGTPGAAPAGPMPAGPMPAGPAPAGAAPARVPEALPGEFATLARRFNAMAERIETEQSRLQAVVAQRTAALEAANAELRRVDATRRRFFASVSHELRTPVTVLLGEAQLALRCPGEEVIALERIAASGGYLRRRLDDLMRLARSEDGQLALRMREADLAAALEEAVTAASAYATANEIVLDGPAPGSAPGGADWQVLGDADALTQIALALIDNAVKFSPPGGRVTVSLWRDAGAGAIGFEIADRGPGFEGDPAALFERYAQESAGRRSGGAGLGLAIVRWVAEAHGGSAGARNRAGGGAVLRVALPLPGAAP